MSLSQKIAAALDGRLGPGELPGRVAVEDGPHRLGLDVTPAGPLGLAFDALEFATAARPEAEPTTESLRAWGGRLAARLTYLMEPLVVLEVDPVGGEVELRSQAPTARGGHRAFYEVRLNRRGTLRLSRVAFDEATRQRRPAPCQMSREVLERLADDLASCASAQG